MSRRLDPSWVVMASIENPQHDRCVDVFTRLDGSSGFEEFRRDAEDGGAWTPVSLRIPMHRGHLLRFDRGQATDLMAATIPI
jgi:hypothetical protein